LISVGRISTLKQKINRFYKVGTDWINIDAIYEYCDEHHRWHTKRGDNERHQKAAQRLWQHIFSS
jgi:predicted AlkP superfamily phosphohydrolase/phosphomutase